MVRMRRSAPLLVALFAVAAGLVGMHTLGHVNDAATSMRTSVAETVMAGMVHHGATDVGHLLASLKPQSAVATDLHGGHGMPVGVAAVCLAVLAAVTVIVGLFMHGRRRAAADRARSILRAVVAPVRGPPPVRLGLRLADLSVLRN